MKKKKKECLNKKEKQNTNTPEEQQAIQTPQKSKKMEKDFHILYKVVALGEYGSGRASILSRFADNTFTEPHFSVGVSICNKIVAKGKANIKLQLWSNGGREVVQQPLAPLLKGAMAVLLVFDLTSSASFEALPRLISEVDYHLGPSAVKIVAGAKADLVGPLGAERVEVGDFLERHNLRFIETSAKTNSNIDELFATLLDLIQETDCFTTNCLDDSVSAPAPASAPVSSPPASSCSLL